MTDPVRVSIYIDPSCPWTRITAAWLREVAPQRGLVLRWRSLSLMQHAIAVVVLIYLYVRHPSRLPKMQRVFSDDAVPAAAGSLVGQEGA